MNFTWNRHNERIVNHRVFCPFEICYQNHTHTWLTNTNPDAIAYTTMHNNCRNAICFVHMWVQRCRGNQLKEREKITNKNRSISRTSTSQRKQWIWKCQSINCMVLNTVHVFHSFFSIVKWLLAHLAHIEWQREAKQQFCWIIWIVCCFNTLEPQTKYTV